jgi:hypothetical protein
MDDFQTRATGQLRKRHENAILENAKRIHEHIGYVLARIEAGNPASVGHYARGIAADAHEIGSRVAVLEGITNAIGILETSDGPAKENDR